jgi:outer membrane protein assembly factor BamB
MMLLVSACSDNEDSEHVDAVDSDTAEEESEEKSQETLGSIEPTDFAEMDKNEVLRIEQNTISEPSIAGSYHNKLYYLDQEFITSVTSTGDEEATFRYDLESDSVVWKNTDYKGNSSATQLRDGIFYMSNGLNKDHAAVSAISGDDGNVLTTYEHEDFEMTHHIQLFDEHLLMFAQTQGGHANDLHLIAFELSTGEFLWEVPVFGIEQAVEIDEAFLYKMKEDAVDSNEGFVAFDKQTGEELYKIDGITNVGVPVVNSSQIYLFDYMESEISSYDFQGNLVDTYSSPISFNLAQQVIPVATDEYVVFADDEALVWLNTDLTEEIRRIEFGEETMLDRMFSTEDFLYLLTRDGDSDTGTDYVMLLDKESGEPQEKIELDHPYEHGAHIAHIYDGKFHLGIHSSDSDLQRVHYIFTGINGESVHR